MHDAYGYLPWFLCIRRPTNGWRGHEFLNVVILFRTFQKKFAKCICASLPFIRCRWAVLRGTSPDGMNSSLREQENRIRRRRFAKVVGASCEIDDLDAVWDRNTAIDGRARWFDHWDVGIRNAAVSSFWRFRARESIAMLNPSGIARTVWRTLGLPGQRRWKPRAFVARKYGLS